MDVALGGRFVGQEIDLAEAPVGVGHSELARDGAAVLRWNDVEHVGLHVVEVELRGQRRDIDVNQSAVGSVFDVALVPSIPCGNEQVLFRLHIFIGVEDDQLGSFLLCREIQRDLAGALVRSRRTAIGRHRDVHDEHAAVRHRLDLSAQRHRLGTCFPGVQHLLLRRRTDERRYRVPDEIKPGREDQAVIGKGYAARKRDAAGHGIDALRLGGHASYAPLVQTVVGHRELGDLPTAAEHEVGQRAGDECAVAFDQGDADRASAPLPDVLGGSRAAEATPDDDDFGRWSAPARAHRNRGDRRGTRTQEVSSAPEHHCAFCAAKYDAAASISASV